MTFETSIERDDKEIRIEVDYHVSKGSRGARGRCGEPLEPDEDPEVEIQSVVDLDSGAQIELTSQEEETVVSKIWDYIDSNIDWH